MTFSQYTIHNGLPVVSTDIPDSNSITILALIKAGSVNEDIPGLAHFVEHAVFKGTEKRPTAFIINDEVERVGGYINAATSQEYTEYYIRMPSAYAAKAADILQDLLFSSTLPENEMTKEKQVVIEEINMYEDMPVRSVPDIFYASLWRDEPWGRPILGTRDSVSAITRDDLARFIAAWYKPKNMLISIAGPVAKTNAIELLEKSFGSIECGDSVSMTPFCGVEEEGRECFEDEHLFIRIDKKPLKQNHFCIGFIALAKGDKREYALEVGSAVLGEGTGSWLWQQVREELGASYYLECEIDAFFKTGLWYIRAGVENSKLYTVLGLIRAGYERLSKGEFTDSELIRAKEYIKGDFIMNLEGSEELARYAAHELFEIGHIKTTEEEIAAIENISKEDIQEVFTAICSGKLYITLLGDQIEMMKVQEALS